ncbi:hypothetical protein ACP70R_024575 [Stipagrostis hirtigluma subsp. patula]
MEKEDVVKKAVASPEEPVVVAAPEEAKLTAPPPPQPQEPAPGDKCYKKTVGEEATFLESAKDYFSQFKDMPAKQHWICLKNWIGQKSSSVFGKQKVEPVVKDGTPEVAFKDDTPEVAKPAAVESH